MNAKTIIAIALAVVAAMFIFAGVQGRSPTQAVSMGGSE